MSVLFAFAFAVLFSFVGVLPPGIVNMTVANYSVKKSLKRARRFINGAILVVFIQSVLGYYFATFLESHPQVMQNLKLVGSVVFILLTIFFLGKGIQNFIDSKDEIKKTSTKSKLKPFLHGIFISGLNVFPIPYYAFVSLYLSDYIKPERDLQFTYLGIKTAIDKYLTRDALGQTFELPQHMFMMIAMFLASKEKPKDKQQKAKDFYDVISTFEVMIATPTLSGARKIRSQLSSCFKKGTKIQTINDEINIENLYLCNDYKLNKNV